MVPDTSSSHEQELLQQSAKHAPTTRMVLLAVLLLIVVTLTGTSLLLVWHRLRQQVTSDVSVDLRRSARAFENAETERFGALEREVALLSELPSLKALLTTNDDRTIQNAASDFWRTSGNDIFGLAGTDGHLRALNTHSQQDEAILARDLAEALQHPGRGYLLTGGHLFRYAARRVYFGNETKGTLLGTVVSGYEINSSYLAEMSSAVDANEAFVSRGVLLGSSLPLGAKDAFSHLRPIPTSGDATEVSLEGERYLAISYDLSSLVDAPLQVIFYRSLRPAELEFRAISRELLLVGGSAVLLGSLLMAFVARGLTRPLEKLAQRVKFLGEGKIYAMEAPPGTREIQQLTLDFLAMQGRLQDSTRARLESERLATIGSMAASVSHDLRHHLASIYANAEFLAAPELTEAERVEFFTDIQAAVMETTEMLESLTLFSRTGQVAQHVPEQMGALLERAVAQVRMHPAAAKVALEISGSSMDAPVMADGKQIERALFNLLLNACQSRRPPDRLCRVTATLEAESEYVRVSVADNGAGVPAAIQHTLFDPFVSSGKQNGTGLGLTLARHIAEDHQGHVVLLGSNSHETVFQLRLPLSRQERLPYRGAVLNPAD